MNTIQLLHDIRRAVIAITGDNETIVRLDVDKDTSDQTLKLVVLSAGMYLPWTADSRDFDQPGMLVGLCSSRVRDEHAAT